MNTVETAFPFKAVIFDMDGVLIDSEWYYLDEQRRFFKDFGIQVGAEDQLQQVGQSHQTFQATLVKWLESVGMQGLTGDEAEAVYEKWVTTQPPRDYRALLNDGAVETVRRLRKRGVRTALASSSPMWNISHVLEVCGFGDLFETIVSGEQFKESKPNPEIYLHTVELLGLPAGECCCVEDSIPGITAGKAAGLYVVAKREGRFGYTQEAADVIIDALPDLLNLRA